MSSCALFEQMRQEQIAAYRYNYCTYDGAYALGVNDANTETSMRPKPAELCDQKVKSEVRKGYREGYSTALKSRPTKVEVNVDNNIGTSNQQECKGSYYNRTCGYNCIWSFGTWYCAKRPSDRCLEAYGKVKCGSNCRVNYGNIICDS